MGCGVSRLDANGLALPARLRPIFLNRLEEMTSRRHSRPLKDSTPSKKELLLHEKDENENHPSCDHGLKTVTTSPKDSVSHGMKLNETKGIHHVKPREDAFDKEVPRVGNKDDTRHEVPKEGNSRENGKSDAKEKVFENVEAKEQFKIEDKSTNADDGDKEDDNDDDERMIGREDDEAFPGSPSFRVYFDHDHDDNDADKNYDAFKDTTSNEDATSSKELSVNKEEVKREKKRRSFRKVLPKGGQAAVKNLLNVKSCYSSSHSVHDRTHLLTGKTAT